MAKNAVNDFSTTPSDNTDIGGINIQGTAPVSNFDGAFRTLMAYIKSWVGTTAGTVAAGDDSRIVKPNAQFVDNSNVATSLASNNTVMALGTTTFTRTTTLEMSNSGALDGRDTIFTAQSGLGSMFKLSGFGSKLKNAYVSDNRSASAAAIKLEGGRFAGVDSVTVVNAGPGVLVMPEAYSSIHTVDKLTGEGITGTGVSMASGISKVRFSNMDLFGKLVTGAGGSGDKPTAGSVGYAQNTPNRTYAVGGHQIVNSNAESVEVGWKFTDSELTMLTNCHGDSCSSYALVLDGNTSDMDINQFFAGTSLGIKAAGTSSNNIIRGLTTRNNGVIPPWGSTDFYSASAPYYDVTVADTARLMIDGNSWRGDKKISVASTAKLVVTGGIWFQGRSGTRLAGGTSGYLGPNGFTLTEDEAMWRLPYDGRSIMIVAAPSDAAGAGNSYTYTVRKNGSNTSLTATVSGASQFDGRGYFELSGVSGDKISIKVDVSPSASSQYHYADVQFIPGY